jgi:hypothetical protein
MRKETTRLLAELVAAHPRRTVIGLWSDLSKLSRKEFEELIEPRTTQASPRRTRRSTAAMTTDAPASRIANLLLGRCALRPEEARGAIKEQLTREGVNVLRVSEPKNLDLEKWLLGLFQTVPASRVMHAALQIAERVPK